MANSWKDQFKGTIKGLLGSKNEAVVYFTRRDLLGEEVGPIQAIWNLEEPQKILKRQTSEGFWKGPKRAKPVFPKNHSDLLGTFKAFRILIERYEFTREYPPIEKAAEFLFSFQPPEGDIRGFIGNQYAPYYTGYLLALLIRAGYSRDPRVEKGIRWLLEMRQLDGGWTIPILTQNFDRKTIYRLTSSHSEPVEPDRQKPFSHNWTDMVLRALAVHPFYRRSEEAKVAGNLLKSRFFKPDYYSSYKSPKYWTRFSFWWPNLLTALESLSLLGFPSEDQDIKKGIQWFLDNRKEDGFWDLENSGKGTAKGKENPLERTWLALRICRMLKGFLEKEKR